MRLLFRDITRFFGVVLILLIFGVAFYKAGFRINLTPSVPVGVYQLHKIEGPLKRGDIVWFCPPDTPLFRQMKADKVIPDGDCPGGYMHMFKPVEAMPGDTVEVTSEGVFVNGQLLPNSKPLSKAAAGRKLVPALGQFQVASGTVWLVSTYHPQSFDSRYFGPFFLRGIESKALHVWNINFLLINN